MQMDIEDPGFDAYLRERFKAAEAAGLQAGRIIVVHKYSYVVSIGRDEVYAETTGKLFGSATSALDRPSVGDWVLVQMLDNDSFAIIREILPRKSSLVRKTAGRKSDLQLIAANVDTALIIQSLDADFNIRRLERYLAMVADGNIDPVVLLSKSDLVDAVEAEEKLRAVKQASPGLSVFTFSNRDKSGLAEVINLFMPGKTHCLLGSSGVGKTTLLNQMMDGQQFDTREVRQDGKGRHTTTSRQLIVLPSGAMVIDTPGMRELGNVVVDAALEDTFDEIIAAAAGCRFNDCAHVSETGCAVLAAVESGEIDETRYRNFIKLREESAFNEMSKIEKRRKDKELGKFYKSAKKSIRRKENKTGF